MAATIESTTKNFEDGTLIVRINDGYGFIVPHTVAVLQVPDVDADIEAARLRIEQQADAKAQIFAALGM